MGSFLAEPARRVYVRAPNWVGDVVMATGVLEALAVHFEGALTVGLRPACAPLLAGLASGNSVVPVHKLRSPAALWRAAAALAAGRYTDALLLTRSLETALVAWLARIPRRVGSLEGRSLLLTDGFREPRQPRRRGREPRRVPRYMGGLYADLAALLGLSGIDTHPVLRATPEEECCAHGLLAGLGIDPEGPFFLLGPGAAYGASKLWPPEHMASAARGIHEGTGWRGLVLSGPAPAEQELARTIAAQAGPFLAAGVGERQIALGPLKAVVRRSRLMVVTDSGPRHFAVAFRVPHVVVMGPTDPRFTDRHMQQATLLRLDLECSPCHCRVCPLGHHRCMRGIPPRRVVEAALERISARGGTA